MPRIRLVTATALNASHERAKAATVHIRIPADGSMPDHSCVASSCESCLRRFRNKAAAKLNCSPSDVQVTVTRDRLAENTPPVVNRIVVTA